MGLNLIESHPVIYTRTQL